MVSLSSTASISTLVFISERFSIELVSISSFNASSEMVSCEGSSVFPVSIVALLPCSRSSLLGPSRSSLELDSWSVSSAFSVSVVALFLNWFTAEVFVNSPSSRVRIDDPSSSTAPTELDVRNSSSSSAFSV